MTDPMEAMAERIRDALNARDMTAFRSLIAEDARWGDSDLPDGRACFNRNDIVATYKRLLAQGVTPTVVETMTGPAGVVCHIDIQWPEATDRRPTLYQVFLIRDGLITRINGMDEREPAIEQVSA